MKADDIVSIIEKIAEKLTGAAEQLYMSAIRASIADGVCYLVAVVVLSFVVCMVYYATLFPRKDCERNEDVCSRLSLGYALITVCTIMWWFALRYGALSLASPEFCAVQKIISIIR